MLGFHPRAAKITWTVALIALLLFCTYSIRKTLFIFLLAVFFSYMVYPAVNRVNAMTPRRISKTISAAVVFAFIIGLLAGLVALIGPPISDEAQALSDKLPTLLQDPHLVRRLPLPDWAVPYADRATGFVQSRLGEGASIALPIAQRIGRAALVVASNLIYVVLIPVLSFLLITEATAMRLAFLSRVSRTGHLIMWRQIVDGLDVLLGRYIRSLLILSAATLVVYSVFFLVAGVPYAMLLAGLAAVLEFIPVIGPLGAAVIALAVSGLAGYDHLLLLVGFIAAYRLFQDYVLNPYLMSGGVEVPPLLVLFGLLAGEEFGGVVGIFLSVPLIATIRIVATAVTQQLRREEHVPTDLALSATSPRTGRQPDRID